MEHSSQHKARRCGEVGRQLAGRTSRTALLSILAGAGACFASPALAQSAVQIQQLQDQIKQLQQQLDIVKNQQTADEQKTSAAAPASNSIPVSRSDDGSLQIGSFNLKFGGFTEFATIYRTRNEAADVGTDFNGIPFPNTARSNESELRFSARQSRISGLLSTDVDKDTHLSAYVESDFLGASDVSNSRESNSYLPRLRQFFATIENSAWGFHFLAGQAWSLITTNMVGITPRSEQVPLTIDAQYVPGFNWARTPQARFVEDFGHGIWAGVSVESPQSLVGGNNPNGTAFASNQANPNANNPGDGTGLFSSNQQFTTDTYPDVIAKLAVDTSFGHFELKGIERIFTDRFNGVNHDTVGGGVGFAAAFHVIPKYLDLQTSMLAGYGIGRYGSGQINDVSFNTAGAFVATPEIEALVGLIGHPMTGTDVYVYAGLENVDSTGTPSGAGFGASNVNNRGCEIELPTAGTCGALTHRLEQITGGFWHDIYKGSFGRVAIGAEGSYTKRFTFPGQGGAPNVDEGVFMTSFRYYPF